jgi:three-Cys-motif partner protein
MTDPAAPGEHAQEFGGAWSVLKVAAVEKYLQAYAQVMSQQRFELSYIDTFAGSGSFTFGDEIPLMPGDEAARVYAGSVKRAMNVAAFKKLFFLEQDTRNLASLRAISGDDPRVQIIPGDANTNIIDICRPELWRGRRGVVFVDPYGPETNWNMLRFIAATKALDMFWLFPLSAVYRNAPRDHALLTPEKRRMVSRCLGCDDWEGTFYGPSKSVMRDLFEEAPMVRHVEYENIENFVMDKLKAIFPHVEKPARLYGPTGAPLFNLFFAVANPSAGAHAPASRIARHLLDAI